MSVAELKNDLHRMVVEKPLFVNFFLSGKGDT